MAEDTYWVKRHERRYPSKAKPRWIAYDVTHRRFVAGFDPRRKKPKAEERDVDAAWQEMPSEKLHLKRELNNSFARGIERGVIHLFKVD